MPWHVFPVHAFGVGRWIGPRLMTGTNGRGREFLIGVVDALVAARPWP
jgi:hypothetical protein